MTMEEEGHGEKKKKIKYRGGKCGRSKKEMGMSENRFIIIIIGKD
jgi:hypothetical protein